jgi:phosphatidylinositol alpha-1,6-mannosyltransferase
METIEWSFASCGIECQRVDLRGAGPAAHARLIAESHRRLRATMPRPRLIVAHRALMPAATLLTRRNPGCGISLLCHGIEVWGTQRGIRSRLERRLMSRPDVRVIAVSNFTAGMLLKDCPAGVLPPGLSKTWFDTLVSASAGSLPHGPELRLVTVFRLADWREKGLPELLAAVGALNLPQIRVTVCGSGEPTQELESLVRGYGNCSLRTGLSDRELARELADADLFVLATRTRRGRHPYGEGFGMVLLEAQVAGTPVVGPAFGGSHDAYLDHVTGVAPVDESVDALARVLGELLSDPIRLARMGRQAGEWARGGSSPELYASRAVARLL